MVNKVSDNVLDAVIRSLGIPAHIFRGDEMTESDWLTSTDPAAMLKYLRGDGAGTLRDWSLISDRKLRLFACACCSSVWHLLTDERSRRAVEVAEKMIEEDFTDVM